MSPTTGRVYHVEFDPPKHEGVCDVDGSRARSSATTTSPRRSASASRSTTSRPRRSIDLLRGARACCAASTARASPTEVHDHIRATIATLRLEDDFEARMIIKKTPDEIDKMAAAGAILVAHARSCSRARSAPGVTTARARRGGREVHPLAGRRARVQGLPRLPRLDLRLAELDGRPRHPRARTGSSAATSSRSTSASSLDGWVADAARTFPVGPVTPVAAQAARRHRGVAVRRRRAVPARQPPRRRLPRRPGARRGRGPRRSCARSSATASAATCTRTRRSPTSASPGAGPLLEEGMVLAVEPMVTAGPPRGPHGRRRLGDLLPGRLAGRPLRVHGRDHGRRAADPHAVARGRRAGRRADDSPPAVGALLPSCRALRARRSVLRVHVRDW